MKFNKLIPELCVFDFNMSKTFYTDILCAKLEYERTEDLFAFFSIEDNQFMIEQIDSDSWMTDEFKYPLGIGINISMEIKDIDKLYKRIKNKNYPFFRKMSKESYQANDELIIQKEFLVQDPNGYLFRFTN